MGTKRDTPNAPESREREWTEGEILFDPGDASTSAFFVRSGDVDVLSPSPGGALRIVDRIGPGWCAGGIDVLTGRERVHQARAASDVRAVEVDADTFRAMCSERPGIALRLLEQQAQQSDDLERRLSAVGAQDLIRPIVYVLLATAEEAERGVRVTTCLRDLSAQSGLSMRQTHRGLQTLFEAKEVRIHDDALWIPEPGALRSHLEGTPFDDALSS